MDVYGIVVASELKTAINGEVRYIPRKKGSHAEDCIISVLANQNGQIQSCFVNVNVYVPNINNGGESVEDVIRTSTLAEICARVLQSRFGDGFRFFLDSQRILAVNGKDEHVISNKLKYQFNNE